VGNVRGADPLDVPNIKIAGKLKHEAQASQHTPTLAVNTEVLAIELDEALILRAEE